MTGFVVQKAKRELIWTKLAIMGASGSGKSYSSLRVASGMLKKLKELGQDKNGKILVVNTEASRGRYYANEFEYDIVDMTAPHSPERYVEVIEFAVEQNYPILIIDSTSHEWEGKGGALELHQAAGGTFQSWFKVTPRHDKFIQKIADSPIHLIATMRGKDAYEVEKSDTGRQIVKKLGVGAQQRPGFEYEFTATFLIDKEIATPQKDNTHLFQDLSGLKLSESDGEKIIAWANSGEGYTPPVRDSSDNLKAKDALVKLALEKVKINPATTKAVLKSFGVTDPKKIEPGDAELIKSISEKLVLIQKEIEVKPETHTEQA